MDVGFKSDIGKRRETNQDAFMVYRPNKECGFFVVADGLGGHQAGEVASGLAVDMMKERLASLGEEIRLDHFPVDEVRSWIEEINRMLIEEGDKDPHHKGMGTTFTMGCVLQTTLLIYHIGDSRLYRVREGLIEKVTNDHSLVEEMVRSGELTEEQAVDHPQKNLLTRALGTDSQIEVDFQRDSIRPSDVYFICSDGLSNFVSDQRLLSIAKEMDPQSAAETKVEEANQNGGGDNITVVVFKPEVNI